VADTGRGAALGRARLEGVGRAVGAGPGTELRDVADTGGGAALGRARPEGVGGAGGGAPGAELGDVADTGRGAALGRAGLAEVGRAIIAGPVTALDDVAGAGGRPADGRPLCVRGAVGATPRAEVGRVAGPGRAAAHGRAWLQGVGRTVVAHPVAALRRIAGARLRQVTLAGRGAAHRAGVPRRMRARRAAPVADVDRARVAVIRARRSARLDTVRGAAGARAGTGLGRVARPGGGAADGGRREEAVGRTARTRAGAGLGRIARPGGGTADGGRRLEAIGRAGVARPCAELCHIAAPGRRPTLRGAGQELAGGGASRAAEPGIATLARIEDAVPARCRLVRGDGRCPGPGGPE